MITSLVFACLALSSTAKVIHEEPELPKAWKRHGSALSEITFHLSLKQPGLEKLHGIAKAVSDPSSGKYGKYLTQEQLDDLLLPPQSTVDAVKKWAAKARCSASAMREVVSITCHSAAAEDLLETKCHELQNSATKQRAVRCSDYYLPDSVHEVTEAVYGLHGLPLPPQPAAATSVSLQTHPANVTPSVITSTYKVAGVTPSGTEKNRQAVAEFQGQTMSSDDLDMFWKIFMPNVSSKLGQVHKFVGDMGEGSSETEATLDIQYIMGVAPGILTEFWYFKPQDFCGDLKKWTQTILSTANPPLVHSVSYGWQGNITELTGCKMQNVNDVDADFAKLAARGITIIFASGDSGAGYTPDEHRCNPPHSIESGVSYTGTVNFNLTAESVEECCVLGSGTMTGGQGWTFTLNSLEPSGKGTCTTFSEVMDKQQNPHATSARKWTGQMKMYPSWPASSPWVTAVGSTRFVNQEIGQPEMATDRFGSGGGFSDMFTAFDNQKTQITHFFNVAPTLPPSGSFPRSGRGTPDVAALGDGYQIVMHGQTSSIGGTSAAAPTFAGLVSLLNEARLAKGQPQMGLLNPWLYQHPEVFTDITRGDNFQGRQFAAPYGFNTTVGWDPVTGLGTPLFDRMLSAATLAHANSLSSIVV